MPLLRYLQYSNSSSASVLRQAKENQLLCCYNGKSKITIHHMDELTNREKCQGLEKVEIVVEISAKNKLKNVIKVTYQRIRGFRGSGSGSCARDPLWERLARSTPRRSEGRQRAPRSR